MLVDKDLELIPSVNFWRGTYVDYKLLKDKNPNTIYFLDDEDENGKPCVTIYLGNKPLKIDTRV